MRIKPMQDIRIRTKLMALGAVCVLGLVILERESVFTASRIKQAGDEMSDIWMNAVIVAEELNTATSDYRIKESRHAVTTDPKLMEALEQEMSRIRGDIEEKFEEYRQLPTWDSDQAFMDEAEVAWDGYLEYSERLIETSKGNDREKATEMMMGHSQELFEKASSLFLEAVAHDKQAVEEQKNQAEALYNKMYMVKLWVIGIVTLIMVGLIWYLIHGIEGPVQALVDAARRVTNGNLDVRLTCRCRDELGILEDAMNQMIQRLEDIVKDEIHLFRETGSENFQAKSGCEQAYRGDFAPILYGFTSLQSRLKEIKRRQGENEASMESEIKQQRVEIEELQRERQQQRERAAGLRVEREKLAERAARLETELERETGKAERLAAELERETEKAAQQTAELEWQKRNEKLASQDGETEETQQRQYIPAKDEDELS